ncbi:hypothetical protein M231_03529 [Tremella mesenterica]|uniref:Transglycosylase SLT domain-containing protein n=1 Tax=Tremella mesenterica TaxID=5217 RepID=A0A4Q1BN98_TREME|nr:hypothetical protein M231_03529 [Tremella mesenterica]
MVMINLNLLLPLIPLLSLVQASTHDPAHMRHRRQSQSLRHVRSDEGARMAPRDNMAHTQAHKLIKKNIKKRGVCRKKGEQAPALVAPSSSSSSIATSTWSTTSTSSYTPPATSSSTDTGGWTNPTDAAMEYAKGQHSTTSSTQDSWTSSTTSSQPAPSTGGGNGGGNSGNNGLLNVNDPTCGWCDSSDENPNGSEDWINCGLNGGGWNPPAVKVEELVSAELTSGGVFDACSAYFDIFTSVGNQYGLPPILLASIALQESSCNSGATGPNGEAGLMQLAQENWDGASNPWDVNWNINAGAKVFMQYYNSNNQNFFAAMGSYNGWKWGLTVGDVAATKAQHCSWQQNLDYLAQIANGWMQNKDGTKIGQYCELS